MEVHTDTYRERETEDTDLSKYKQKRTDKHATEKKERKKKERNCYH